MEKYDHKKIEKKWQKRWAETHAFRADDTSHKEKLYVLDMFPYPSGSGLHVGHVEGYTATDVYSRFKRAQGYNVLHPMGWDSFGLPAENYAIKTGVPPQKTTDDAIATFRTQIQSLGLSYDWEREIGAHTPEYYAWTQWFFLFLYKNGLAEKRLAKVNWCPNDQTVLANEQTVSESGEKGVCVRCGAKVVQKDLEQWFFKITDFADALVDDLDQVDWPESTKINQRNWIGRSEGAEIEFAVAGSNEKIKVFTTRPDTLFGATYMVLAPEHALVQQLQAQIQNGDEVAAYVAAAANKTDLDRQTEGKEKTGVELKGVKAINPANKEEIPVFIADYVLGGYGTGAIMAVPAHDERDFAFAKKFGVSIKQVVAPYIVNTGTDAPHSDTDIVEFRAATAIIKHWSDEAYYVVDFSPTHRGFVGGHVEENETLEETIRRETKEESGYSDIQSVTEILEYSIGRGYKTRKQREELCIDSCFVVTLNSDTRVEIEDKETKQGSWKTAEEILSDKGFSSNHRFFFQLYQQNQPYTGAGKLVNSGDFNNLDSDEAKKKITEFVDGKLTKTYKLRDWLVSRQRYWGAPIPVVYDPQGQAHPVPEEHLPWLLPTDVEFRPTGTSPLGQSKELLERTERIFGKGWRPEIDTMDTFVCSSWYYFRFADPHNTKAFANQESIAKWQPVDLYMGGAEHTVLHLMYARFITKALQRHGLVPFSEPFKKLRHQGTILAEDGSKMSKSKGNVINPDDVVNDFGADTLRLYEMFMGPLETMKPWSTQNIIGSRRFLERVWALQAKVVEGAATQQTESLLQQTIQKVTDDLEVLKLNTAISALMILSNHLSDLKEVPKSTYTTLLQLVGPFAPHAAEQLWELLGYTTSVHTVAWPLADATKIIADTATVAIQINGKVRATIALAANISEQEALAAARAEEGVLKWLQRGKEVKAVYVPGKIINFVVVEVSGQER